MYKWIRINREKIARYGKLLLEDKELDSTLFAGKSNDPEEVNFIYTYHIHIHIHIHIRVYIHNCIYE
jgi:hypothetical protein